MDLGPGGAYLLRGGYTIGRKGREDCSQEVDRQLTGFVELRA